MLVELRLEEYTRIHPLLAGDRVNMEIKGVAAGNNPGWVFVDKKENPETALVFSHGQMGFYFLGREDNPLFIAEVRKTIEDLRPRLAVLGVDEFEFSGTSLEWERALTQLFQDKNLAQFPQLLYTYPNLQEAQLPDTVQGNGYQVVEISQELMTSEDISTSFAKRILLEWWDSLDSFLAKGSGYCVICAEQVVSLCYTSFVAQGEWELGVDTLGDFRQRGFAKLATVEMLRKCQEQDAHVYWDCMETNAPSRRLAAGLGLTLAYTYTVYCFSLT